ncbi:hypothetical protein [Salinifilum ghardaiensis]
MIGQDRGGTTSERDPGSRRRPPHDGDPLDDAVGTVRVHPADERTAPRARRVIKSSNGGWVHLTQESIPAPARPWEELRTWPRQSLVELARVLGHADAPSCAHRRELPERATPTFWEAAKAYCRALAAASDSIEYWRGRCRGGSGGASEARRGNSA